MVIRGPSIRVSWGEYWERLVGPLLLCGDWSLWESRLLQARCDEWIPCLADGIKVKHVGRRLKGKAER